MTINTTEHSLQPLSY